MKPLDEIVMMHEHVPHRERQDAVSVRILNLFLVPLVRLCLANGITFVTVKDVLKRALVHETIALHPNAPMHGTVSRVSTATGINRREVAQLVNIEAPERKTKPPIAAKYLHAGRQILLGETMTASRAYSIGKGSRQALKHLHS